ncbi:MAG: hypothetical protein CME63_09400 [Halobacteriovoraceae bacterium]|nr:hypothetical protein [Halobacteriovoraceae bacterium]|tara:strand:+ start:152625 stop:154367 length:1743 start_codon:yes stop_codon:yes gene_type:complete
MIKITQAILLFMFSISSQAIDWSTQCRDINSENRRRASIECNQVEVALNPLRQEVISELNGVLNDWNLIETASLNLKARIQTEIDEEKNFLRWLRGDEGIDSHEEQYLKLNQDFESLKEIISKQRELSSCESEICNRDKAILNELKVSILTKNSFLADPEVEKCLSLEIEESDSRCRKDAFFSSVFNFVNFRIDLRDEINKQLRLETNMLHNGKGTYEVFDKLYTLSGSDHYYAYLIPEVLELAEKNPEKWMATACNILDKKEFRENLFFAGEVALEASLIIAPFFFPPLGVLRVARLGYLSRYGLTAERLSAVATALPTAAYFSHSDLIETQNRCIAMQEIYRSTPSSESYKKYQSCLEEVADKKMGMASNMLLSVTPVPFAARAEQIVGKGIDIIRAQAGDVLSIIRPSIGDAKNLADDYYKYVADVYSERLNLSAEEIEGFIQSSRQMGDRTTLIVRTKTNPTTGPPEFKGGIGVVTAENGEELLPLEKATGFRVPRGEGNKAVEVVRLVASDEKNPNLMKELIEEAMSTIGKDPSITKAYVYTSRIHERLYRRLGIPYTIVNRPNKRDVILEFNVN